MANLLKKKKRLSKRVIADIAHDMAYVDYLPDGHLACNRQSKTQANVVCGCPFFHCVLDEEKRSIYLVCSNCEQQITLVFPNETDLRGLGFGQFQCAKHPKSCFVFIKSHEYCSVGCQHCETEIDIRIWNDHVAADDGLIVQ